MTQEDKELLLKDICARLPYEVQCEIGGLRHGPYTFTGNDVEDLIAGRTFKPYLRPMSSMTEEEKKERKYYVTEFEYDNYWYPGRYTDYVGVSELENYIDWLNKHHFDYRGLIGKGLALEAPEGMYDFNN